MRWAGVLLILSIPLSSGCSLLIARSGKDLSALTTREKVRAEFGEPSTSGIVDGKTYDEYHTRRKIYDPMFYNELYMAVGMSCGLFEPIAFPLALYDLGSNTITGQELRFVYRADGTVSDVSLDGNHTGYQPPLQDEVSDRR